MAADSASVECSCGGEPDCSECGHDERSGDSRSSYCTSYDVGSCCSCSEGMSCGCSASDDEDPPSGGHCVRAAAAKRARAASADDDAQEPAAKRPRPDDLPAVMRFLYVADDFPRLMSALRTTVAEWVGPVGGVAVSVDDANEGGDADGDVVMTVRARDEDLLVDAVHEVFRWYHGGRPEWTADVLVDADVVYGTLRADATWREVRPDPGLRDPAGSAVRVVRVTASASETLRRVARLAAMCAGREDPAVAEAASAAVPRRRQLPADGPLQPAAGAWDPLPGIEPLNLSSSDED